MKSKEILQIILITFFGMLGCVLIGFIFYNSSIFITTRTDFQFVAAGFYGALFFSFLEYRPVREQIFVMIIILIMNLIIFTGKSLSTAYVIRDILYLGGLFLSIKLYHQFIKKNPKVKYYLRSFALALIYGLLNVASVTIIYIINANANIPPVSFIYAIARYGILIGLGIGLGIDFYLQNIKQKS